MWRRSALPLRLSFMQSGTIVPIFTSSQGFRPKLVLASGILWMKSFHLKLLLTAKNGFIFSFVKNMSKYIFSQ